MKNYDDAASHNTILMLFQNQQNRNKSANICKMEKQCQSQKLVEILECQKLVLRAKSKGKGIIPANFPVAS